MKVEKRELKMKKEFLSLIIFFFQAEDGIRDAQESRGLEMCIRDSYLTWSPTTTPLMGLLPYKVGVSYHVSGVS